MKKGLLASTALVGAGALMAGTAGAAEAPEYKLGGNMNFQFYYMDQDWSMMEPDGLAGGIDFNMPTDSAANADTIQDHGWYFGVDEAELALNVKGAADNGLKYGFKIEINADTTDGKVADEARIQLSGNWGTIQMGDEDGAEDIMNWGGESLIGGAGGFHYGDVAADTLLRIEAAETGVQTGSFERQFYYTKGQVFGAPGNAEIAGDTSDRTKLSYFSPRFSGFQVGASITPVIGGGDEGDEFKEDGSFENHYGLGANYVNDFGDLRIRASAVYSAASAVNNPGDWQYGDISAYSVGLVIGWGPFDIGGNYTDNGDSGQANVWNGSDGVWVDGNETSYWDVAARFTTGPMKFSVGYFESTVEYAEYQNNWILDGIGGDSEGTFTQLVLTADYNAAPGLSFYAEVSLIDDDPGIESNEFFAPVSQTNSATAVVLGTNIKF